MPCTTLIQKSYVAIFKSLFLIHKIILNETLKLYSFPRQKKNVKKLDSWRLRRFRPTNFKTLAMLQFNNDENWEHALLCFFVAKRHQEFLHHPVWKIRCQYKIQTWRTFFDDLTDFINVFSQLSFKSLQCSFWRMKWLVQTGY